MDLATLGLAIDSSPAASAATDLDRLTASAAKTEASFAGVEAGAAKAGAGVKQAAGATVEYSAATSNAAKAFDLHTRAVNDNIVAHGAHARALGNSSIAVQEATHVIRSLSEMLAAGVDPLRAFTMEGGRIVTLFQYGGGVSGVLSTLTGIVGGLVNPFTIGAAAVAGFGAAALMATENYKTMRAELDRSLSGVGHASGLSTDALNNLAVSGASANGLSAASGRSVAETLVSTGHASASNLTAALGLVRGSAATFGENYDEAGARLAKIFDDPARGADELNKRLGFLSASTRQYIQDLVEQGRQQDAIAAVMSAAAPGLNTQARPQSNAERFLNWWSDRNAQIEAGNFGGAPKDSVSPEMQSYRRNSAAEIFQSQVSPWVPTPADAYDPARDSVNNAENIRRAGQLTKQERDDVLANRQSLSASDIARGVLSGDYAEVHAQNNLKSLQAAVMDPNVLDKMSVSTDQANRAIADLTNQLAALGTPLSRMREDGALAVASASARTAAERVAVDMERARVDVLRHSGDSLLAATSAENVRNLAIAAGTREALDSLHSSRNAAALVGLSPFDRAMAEAGQHSQDLRDRILIPSGTGTDSPASGMTNPGNIRNGPWAASQPGYAGGGAFASFDSAEAGYRAASALLDQYARHGITTPAAITSKWAPAGDGANDPAAYANSIRKLTGLDPNSPLPNTPDARSAYLYGMTKVEHGSAPYSQDQIAAMLSGHPATSVPSSATASMALGADDQTRKMTAAMSLLFPGVQQTNAALKSQEDLLKVQQATMGQSADAVASATEKQKEWNTVNESGATQQKLINALGADGAKVWAELTAKIDENASAAGRLAKEREDLQNLVGAMDDVRSAARGGLGTFVDDMLHGTSAAQAFRDALSSVAEKILSAQEDTLVNNLLGKSGTTGGGLFGGGLSSILQSFGVGGASSATAATPMSNNGAIGFHNATGTNDWQGGPTWVGEAGPEVVDLPQHAQVIPNNALGGGSGWEVHIHNSPTATGTPQISRGPDGKQQLRVMISDILTQEAASNGRGYRAFASRATTTRFGN